MDCRDTQERLSEYQDGLLPGAVAEGVSGHLRECGECASVARSLAALRELLQVLPPDPAPPELLGRVREAVDRESAETPAGAHGAPDPASKRSMLSRLRIPLEAAAAVLLLASVYWYQKGVPPASPPRLPPATSGVTASAPPAVTESAAPRPAPSRNPAERQEAATPLRTDATPPPLPGKPQIPPADASTGRGEAASRPPGAPEPKVRVYSKADLPAAPAVRASTDSERVGSGGFTESPPADGKPEPLARLLRPLPYGREVLLEVAPEGREGAGERIAAAAWRLGGSVERVDRPSAEGAASVRVLLPEAAAPAFFEELDRIGKVPPEGKPAGVDLPAGPIPGTVAYTVRVRVR